MTTDIERLQAEIAAQRDQHAAFRTSVRGEVLGKYFSEKWCQPGTEGVLKDLDLPPLTFDVSGEAMVSIRITEVKGASSLAEAQARVTAALGAICSDSGITWSLDRVSASLDARASDDRPDAARITRTPSRTRDDYPF